MEITQRMEEMEAYRQSLIPQVTDENELSIVTPGDIKSIVETSDWPIHMQELEGLPFDDAKKEEILSAYVGVEPRPLNMYFNKDVKIHGSIFYYHPNYISNKEGEKGQVKAGYYSLLFLTDMKDEDGNYIVLKTSSVALSQHAYYIMRKRSWYIWRDSDGKPCPAVYRFTQSGSGKSHRMIRVG